MQSPDLTHNSAIIYPPAADAAPFGSDTAAEAHLAHAAAHSPRLAGAVDLVWTPEETRDIMDR